MSDLVTRAQLDMLAALLGVEPERLRHLERLGSDDLRALRERISDRLFDELAPVFARVSKLAPLVPNGLVATLAQAVVPPLVAGRAAGALGIEHPDRAVGVLAGLSPRYMADCAPYLDPRVIAVLAPRIPVEVLIPAADELMRRRAYATASFFLDYAPIELAPAFERGMPDKAGLLRTVALTQSPERLNLVIAAMPRDRVQHVIRTAAAGPPELLLAGLSVLARLEPALAAELAESLFAQLDGDRDAALAGVLRTALEHDAVAELVAAAERAGRRADLERVAADLGPDAARRIAEHPAPSPTS